MRRLRQLIVALFLFALAPTAARAQSETPGETGVEAGAPADHPELDAGVPEVRAAAPAELNAPTANIEEVSLEDLLDVVVTASKNEQRVDEAPAIISVVTADRIAARGYHTVAEVVSDVAGIYVVDDLYQPSIGVRGVSAGLRSWSHIIKVLIDGQPVPFRVDGTSWTGLELIPLSAVQQIEVLRGPASALFGADAFLGVVNIITRSGSAVGGGKAVGGRVTAVGHMVNGNPGAGGEAVVGGESGSISWMIAAAAERVNRSGLTLPATYPNFNPERFGSSAAAPRTTRTDAAVPISAYGRAEYQTSVGTFGMTAHLEKLTTGANFQDWAPLPTEPTTVDHHSAFVRAHYRSLPSDRHGFQASLTFAEGGFDPREHLEVNDPGKYFGRHASYRALDLNLEYSLTPIEPLTTRVGLDLSNEWHDLLQYSVVLKQDLGVNKKGYRIALGMPRSVNLPSGGLYLQGALTPFKRLLLTVGGRIDAYQGSTGPVLVPTARAAAIFRFAEASSVKLLYGRSFKSPSPMLRYAPGGLGVNDILGNPDLLHETADTVELGASWLPGQGAVRLEGNVFWTTIDNFTEFVTNGQNFIARNRQTATSVGFELEASYRHALGELFVQYSFANAERPFDASSFFASSDDADAGRVRLAAYPTHLIRTGLTLPLERAGLLLHLMVGYVGDRRGNESTILANNRRVYVIPGYAPMDLAVSTRGVKLIGDHELRLMLKVRDVLDQRSPEPGFHGADLPALGRRFTLSISQTW